jgi:hypothetical protein
MSEKRYAWHGFLQRPRQALKIIIKSKGLIS